MGWDVLHCHLVTMVTCCYGNRPRKKLGSQDEGFFFSKREVSEKKNDEKPKTQSGGACYQVQTHISSTLQTLA